MGSSERCKEKQMLPKTVPGWDMLFRDGLMLLHDGASLAEVRGMLDASVGIRCGSEDWRGLTWSTASGLGSLPIYLVRHVEYESVARKLNCSEMEIGFMHSRLESAWYIGDVLHREHAVEYLMRATLGGNRFAKRVLDWLASDRGQGIHTTKDAGRQEYLRAIRNGERERAVELGRMVGGAEMGKGNARPDATMVVKMGSKQQQAMAANNIGYLLLHGAPGIAQNVEESIKYYEMGVAWGSASAACNLGFVYYIGAGEFRRDLRRAKALYELAIERGERNYAPRNLAILLNHGGRHVKADMATAAQLLLLGIREGEKSAQVKCRRSLVIIMRTWRMRFMPKALRTECLAALHGDSTSGVDCIPAEDYAGDRTPMHFAPSPF